jgi:hypothetical protein
MGSLNERVAALEKQHVDDAKGESNFRQAILSVTGYQNLVAQKGADLELAALRIGTAYSTAAGRHTKTLDTVGKMDALKVQLMFSVLTVATSGILSWAAEAAKAAAEAKTAADIAKLAELEKSARDQFGAGAADKIKTVFGAAETHVKQAASDRAVLSTIIKDTMAAGLGEGFSALGPMYAPPPPSEPVSIDPLKYQNDLLDRIKNLERPALGYIGNMITDMKTWPKQKWLEYDDSKFQTEQANWKTQADRLGGPDLLPKADVMADDLERGMWAAWMPALRTVEHHTDVLIGPDDIEAFKSISGPLEERFKALGILQAAGVTVKWTQFAETEDRPLMDWAKKFTVPTWGASPPASP